MDWMPCENDALQKNVEPKSSVRLHTEKVFWKRFLTRERMDSLLIAVSGKPAEDANKLDGDVAFRNQIHTEQGFNSFKVFYLRLKGGAYINCYTASGTNGLYETPPTMLCSLPFITIYWETENFAVSVFIPICPGTAPAWCLP